MSFGRNFRSQGGTCHGDYLSAFHENNFSQSYRSRSRNNYERNFSNFCDYPAKFREPVDHFNFLKAEYSAFPKHESLPSLKRRKYSTSTWGESGRYYYPPVVYDSAISFSSNPAPPARGNADLSTSGRKRDRCRLEDDELGFMSKDEIERYSPSRKDGIDVICERHLRYSYCAYLQNLGMKLQLPQTTIGTAMVLCHRFFVRRSHACHDRFIIGTAALFLAAKSEETPCPLNNVLRVSSEIFHKKDFNYLSYLLPVDWFERYRERVLEAEHMILTTLNFELEVQHPYDPLTSILNKLGLSQTVLVTLALNLISEGVLTRLPCWLV